MQKITPFLWFDNNAEDAMNFYTLIFKDSKIGIINRLNSVGPEKPGSAITGTFEIEGQEFMFINGGPGFKFTPAMSFFIRCSDQAEVDYYWKALTEGGVEQQCGWLTDKFGISWQVVPDALSDYIGGPDPLRSQKAMVAMLQMTKLDIAELKAAYESEDSTPPVALPPQTK